MTSEFTRREVLVGAAVLAGAACNTRPVGQCEAPKAAASTADYSDVPEDEALFPLGVQAGSMRDTSAIVWGYASDGADKTLRVWSDDAPGTEQMVVLTEGYGKVELTGLRPNTRYSYAWFSDTARSTIGSFRTAYAEGCAAPLKVIATSCTQIQNAPFKALEISSRFDADVFCHMGDMVYQTSDDAAAFRSLWQRTLQDPGYRALLRRQGTYITWDDHEFSSSERLAEGESPAKIEIAKNAFFDHLPVKPGAEGQLWASYRWGDTAEFFVLDSRLERLIETRGTQDATYISQAQMKWLQDGLKNSKAHFKIVLNSVPMIRWPDIWAFQGDRWQGYEPQREALLSHIKKNEIRNVWFLSGDFHVGVVGRLDEDHANMFEILCGPGGNGPNPLLALKELGAMTEDELYPKEQFLHFNWQFAATHLTLDPQKDSIRVQFIDANTEAVLFDQELSQRS